MLNIIADSLLIATMQHPLKSHPEDSRFAHDEGTAVRSDRRHRKGWLSIAGLLR